MKRITKEEVNCSLCTRTKKRNIKHKCTMSIHKSQMLTANLFYYTVVPVFNVAVSVLFYSCYSVVSAAWLFRFSTCTVSKCLDAL